MCDVELSAACLRAEAAAVVRTTPFQTPKTYVELLCSIDDSDLTASLHHSLSSEQHSNNIRTTHRITSDNIGQHSGRNTTRKRTYGPWASRRSSWRRANPPTTRCTPCACSFSSPRPRHLTSRAIRCPRSSRLDTRCEMRRRWSSPLVAAFGCGWKRPDNVAQQLTPPS